MNRRTFIKSTLGFGLYHLSGASNFSHAAFPTQFNKTVLHIMLEGGPDFRHLIVPVPPSTDPSPGSEDNYASAWWKSRSSLIEIEEGNWSQYRNYFSQHYDQITVSGKTFGILKVAGFLKELLTSNQAAYICNVIGSKNRNHSHSQLIWESGSLSTGSHDASVSGWGGRLAVLSNKKLLSVSSRVKLFANGPHATNPQDHENSHVISASNMENIALAYNASWFENENQWGISDQGAMYRAVKNYYEAKRESIPPSSPYYQFMVHEKNLREFGQLVDSHLTTGIDPASGYVTNNSSYQKRRPVLFDNLLKSGVLRNRGFGRQMLNAYYGLACNDLPNLASNVISANYGGWDSHKFEHNSNSGIIPKIEDIFGVDKGLHTLFKALGEDMPNALSQLTIVIGGEFGRQLRSNGDDGTDHGRGNGMFVLGPAVNGGIYGDLFPDSEIERMSQFNQDIEGKTSVIQVCKRICDWAQADSGSQVFTDSSSDANLLESDQILNFLTT
ncbi:MAG: DUF1501 domain-containing protein [Candidatus Cloacimonetes bacterium]|nr:DUF1501 domain-containing protein [Candidatus Cloacimonadota bacterium]